MKCFHSLCYGSDNICVDLIFVLDFAFLKRNVQSGGREKERVMQSAQDMGPAVMDETKGPSSSGCCP